MVPDSERDMGSPSGPSGSTIAGILLFGLIRRNSSSNCSPTLCPPARARKEARPLLERWSPSSHSVSASNKGRSAAPCVFSSLSTVTLQWSSLSVRAQYRRSSAHEQTSHQIRLNETRVRAACMGALPCSSSPRKREATIRTPGLRQQEEPDQLKCLQLRCYYQRDSHLQGGARL